MKTSHILNSTLLAILVGAGALGCAHVDVYHPGGGKASGIRVGGSSVYLIVSAPDYSQIIVAPDPSKDQMLDPVTVFAKQDFNFELAADGTLSKMTANQDTSAAIQALSDAAKTFAQIASGKIASGDVVYKTSFGLKPGIYRLESTDGVLKFSPVVKIAD